MLTEELWIPADRRRWRRCAAEEVPPCRYHHPPHSTAGQWTGRRHGQWCQSCDRGDPLRSIPAGAATQAAMRLAVLGATGRTGHRLISEALKKGHRVTAVVRSPNKLKQKHDNLSVVRASVFSAEELTKAFSGHDAVVSALGFSRSPPVTGYTDAGKATVAAMRASGVKRLVVMTAFHTDVNSGRGQGFIVNLFIKFLKHLLTNMRELELYLESEATDLDWTVVRPGGLNDKPPRDQSPLEQKEGAMFITGSGVASYIPRANVARFMVEQLDDQTYVRKAVAIAVNS